MNITIIGTGNVGGAMATGWAKAGHTLHLGVQDVNKALKKSLLVIAFERGLVVIKSMD